MSETPEVQTEAELFPVLDLAAIRVAAKTFQSQAAAVDKLHDELSAGTGAPGLWAAYAAYRRIVGDADAVLRGIDTLEALQTPQDSTSESNTA